MRLFSRRKNRDERRNEAEVAAQAEVVEETPAPETSRRRRGPWDITDVPERGDRIDLGALWVPTRPGLELRLEVDKTTNNVTAVGLAFVESYLQLQAFAAPRTEGIWEEVRDEIAASITKQGGTIDKLRGPYGLELLGRVPVRTEEGRTGHRPIRFLGVDGDRWFLRGVITGKAASEAPAAAELESVFSDVVVIRDDVARPPRDLLPLTPPDLTGSGSPAPLTPPNVTPDAS